MALYIMESSNSIEDLVSSLNLSLDEQTALEEAVILEAEEEKNQYRLLNEKSSVLPRIFLCRKNNLFGYT